MLTVKQLISNVSGVFKQLYGSLSRANLDCMSSCEQDQSESPATPDSKDIPIAKSMESNHTINNCAETRAKKCRYCFGDTNHDRSICPARHAVCSFCSIRGHFRCACEKLHRLSTPQTVLSYAVLNQVSVKSLAKSIVPVWVNGKELSALIDTGSTLSYIDSKIAQYLCLPSRSQNHTICLASSNSIVNSTELALVSEFRMNGFTYNNLNISVLTGLCCDVLIGHDILSEHGNLVVNFGGSKDDMIVNNEQSSDSIPPICSVAVANVQPPLLFDNLSADCKPVICKSRRYSEEDSQFIQQEVQKLLESGIVEPCRSPWRAQVVITKDDRHKKRMVIDYSKTINKYTLLDAFPLPRMDDMAFEVSRCKVFSTFDLKSAYHQVPISEDEKPYTAFEADNNLYQFTRIPFGVTNGVSAFQRTITGKIKENDLQKTWAYLDNVTIGGINQQDHDLNVNRFLQMIKDCNLTLNEDKTISSVSEIKMLGYCISHMKVKPDPDRMQPLLNLPIPEDPKSLKRALGLFSYYSQWIEKFSDKVKPLTRNPSFPLNQDAVTAFNLMKQDIVKASLSCPNPHDQLVVETDASDVALSGTLTQKGRPIAFFSRTIQSHEKNHASIEKEAAAIVECCRKWRHYLLRNKFKLITDQEAVSFIFDEKRHGKTKNNKIERWRIDLSCFDFEIRFRPGVQNLPADCLSRAICSASALSEQTLYELHDGLAHPGIGRMYNFVRSRNLPYSMQDVKNMTGKCRICAELKPQFLRPVNPPLIKATQPFERISIDFKGPLPSVTQNKYFLNVVDEYSRFPFVFPSKNMESSTIIEHLGQLFSIFGLPGYVHSDNGPSLISGEFRNWLISMGIPYSNSAGYNPKGNGQVERYNGVIWKSILLALKSKKLEPKHWETVLPAVLHSQRTLVCTATNSTPHDRLFSFQRRTVTGHSLPTWIMTNGKALVKIHVRKTKYDPWVEECEIVHATPRYAQIRTSSGKEQTVSLRDLAPLPSGEAVDTVNPPIVEPVINSPELSEKLPITEIKSPQIINDLPIVTDNSKPSSVSPVRRSTRSSVPVERLSYDTLGGN